MKKINSLLKDYAELKNEVVLQKLERTTHLKEHIKIAKKILHQLRLYVRDYKFLSSKDEIHFFKNIKPHIHADFIFYNSQLKFKITLRTIKGLNYSREQTIRLVFN
jgi:hypothetical protein